MSAAVIPFRPRPRNTKHYFGGCPECGDQDGYMNVSSNHWCVCDTHKTKWCIGANLFSGWQDESREEWERNAAKLEGYREVEPLSLDPEPAA